MQECIFPKRIDVCSHTVYENLLKKQPLQIGLSEKYITSFKKNDFIVLDYGKEMSGSIRILTYTAKNISVRIRFGESLTECCAELGGKQNATNNHSLRDFTVKLQDYSDMTFCNTGFRFVRIDFSGAAQIKSIVAQNSILNKKSLFVYNGEDEHIKKIFLTAKRTIDLCAAGKYLWDGIKRDRLVWIGDIHPEMLALTALYGRMKIIERSLEFVKEQTPLPEWMNWYPMYSMWWIIIVADYFTITGAEDFTVRQIEYISGLMDLMLNYVTEEGETNYPLNFVDWPTHETDDEIQGVRAINIIATKKAIQLLSRFGESCENAEKLLTRLMKKDIKVQESKSVLGLKYFAVGLNKEDKQKLIAGGAKGLTTFMGYYILKAVASFNKGKAIEIMKAYYGGMIEKGATTFWEDFDIDWLQNSCRIDEMPKVGQKDIHGDFGAYCYKGFRHSLCHGWSAGIIAFIKDECCFQLPINS
ncbi:MAG: alpha-L-rhamnosidase [Clostridia bacterium]|nr:alpha-L-rhamnosidase [Clostridia bacterium]